MSELTILNDFFKMYVRSEHTQGYYNIRIMNFIMRGVVTL